MRNVLCGDFSANGMYAPEQGTQFSYNNTYVLENVFSHSSRFSMYFFPRKNKISFYRSFKSYLCLYHDEVIKQFFSLSLYGNLDLNVGFCTENQKKKIKSNQQKRIILSYTYTGITKYPGTEINRFNHKWVVKN